MFKIEHHFFYGWDDLNTDDIEYFATKSEAQTEIDDICAAPALDYVSADFRVAIATPPF